MRTMHTLVCFTDLKQHCRSPGWVRSIVSHREVCLGRWRSGSLTSWYCPQTQTCGTYLGFLSPPPPPSASSSSAGYVAPWHFWSWASTSLRKTQRWGTLSHCIRRSLWLLQQQPAIQSEHKHSCHSNLLPVSKALTDWSGGERLAAESSGRSTKSQISPRHLLKMDAWMFTWEPKQRTYKIMSTQFLDTNKWFLFF